MMRHTEQLKTMPLTLTNNKNIQHTSCDTIWQILMSTQLLTKTFICKQARIITKKKTSNQLLLHCYKSTSIPHGQGSNS